MTKEFRNIAKATWWSVSNCIKKIIYITAPDILPSAPNPKDDVCAVFHVCVCTCFGAFWPWLIISFLSEITRFSNYTAVKHEDWSLQPISEDGRFNRRIMKENNKWKISSLFNGLDWRYIFIMASLATLTQSLRRLVIYLLVAVWYIK